MSITMRDQDCDTRSMLYRMRHFLLDPQSSVMYGFPNFTGSWEEQREQVLDFDLTQLEHISDWHLSKQREIGRKTLKVFRSLVPYKPKTTRIENEAKACAVSNMGLRDYFAGHALAGLLAGRDHFAGQAIAGLLEGSFNINGKSQEPEDVYAIGAYEFADAMIKQRDKKGE